jgi:hypothetical protein
LRGRDYKTTKIAVPSSDPISEEIGLLLETINSAWLSGNPDAVTLALSACFHPDMVIKDCKLKTAAAGRDACVQSYVEFIQQARVSAFEQGEPDIRVFGDSVIASYDWRIVYSLEGSDCDETGGDIFMFVRAEGKWLAVWRAMLTGG